MNNKAIKVLLFVLMVFFTLQLVSQLLFKLAESRGGEGQLGLLSWSSRFMPPDAEPVFLYAYTLLMGNEERRDNRVTLESIREFERSLVRNRLYYNSYYYLGKALLLYDFPRSPYFDRAAAAFKRASLLRGAKNPGIAADTLVLMLSRWPFLTDDDKHFCRELMEKSGPMLGKENVNLILDAWQLYCRDIDFLKAFLKRTPKFYPAAARQLSQLEIQLPVRQAFLARYEVYLLNWLEIVCRQYRSLPDVPLEHLKYYYKKSTVDGYHRLAKDPDFDEDRYLELRRKLILDILRLVFAPGEWQSDPAKQKDIREYTLEYMNICRSRKDMQALEELLDRNAFFDSRDLKDFSIIQRFYSKTGNRRALVSETERLLRSIGYVRKGHMNDYIDILLALSDAYVKNNLLTRSAALLREVEKMSPGLPAVHWRIMKIETIIGDWREQGESRGRKREKDRQILNSRYIELHSFNTLKTVYLLDSGEITIFMSEGLKKKLKDRHLFQVFIDGKIRYEVYIGQLKAGGVVIKVGQKMEKYEVLVKIS